MTTRLTYVVRGLDCANESRAIQSALGNLAGVSSVEFDLVRGRTFVEFDGLLTSAREIQQAIRKVGFQSEVEGQGARDASKVSSHRMRFAGIAAITLAVGALLTWFADALPPALDRPWLAKSMLAVTIVLSARFFAVRAFQSLRQRHADMNVLVVVASLGALLLGDWIEGASVAFLFAIANLLESWSATRVRKSIERFLELTPEVAERLDESGVIAVQVHPDEIREGDLLLVKPGARIPADGIVENGHSSVDQSALTGESIPIEVAPGDTLYAGAMNGESTLRIRATCDASHSRAQRVKEAISQAQNLRSPTERWVERFARVYTPIVLLLALAVFALPAMMGLDAREWFYNALVVILVACPCALVISTPVTMVSAVSSLARGGVLVRGAESVELAARVRAVAFDKTGVLTTGQLRVARIRAFGDVSEREALAAAASLETQSEHPIAKAVVEAASRRQLTLSTVSDFRALPGRGGEGSVGGARVWIGNAAMARERGALSTEGEAQMALWNRDGGALVCVGSGSELWLMLSLQDQARTGAQYALQWLRRNGMRPLVMLTGDHPANALRLADEVGLSEVRADLLPEGKLAALRELDLRHGPVAMVGDGINDAPAMAAAAFSIAAGDRASHVTLQAADAVVWNGDLRKVPWLFEQSKRAMRIVLENVVIAVGSKLAFVVLAWFGMATLWMAVLADVGATVFVTFNGLRMLARRQSPDMETSEELSVASTSS